MADVGVRCSVCQGPGLMTVITFWKPDPTDLRPCSSDDGAHGASASKASRVEITYRTGGGGAGNVRLCLRRTARPTRDLALWVAIRNRTHAVNFGVGRS